MCDVLATPCGDGRHPSEIGKVVDLVLAAVSFVPLWAGQTADSSNLTTRTSAGFTMYVRESDPEMTSSSAARGAFVNARC
jgi:hypothetical protein